MNRKNIIISIFLFIIGTFLILISLFVVKDKYRNDISNENELVEEENDKILGLSFKPETILDNDGLLVFDFKQTEEKDENNNSLIRINFTLYNSVDSDIINKSLIIKFYNNDKELSSYEYNIENLKSGEQKEVEFEENIDYDSNIKCALIYNNYQLLKLNRNVYEKKYGSLGTPITKEEAIKILDENIKNLNS